MKSSIELDKKRQWSSQENTLLKDLYPNFSSKKWKKISQIFKQKGYDRSQLEIRQRWTNFQDPNLLFTQWTDEELQTLYKGYTKFGSKWCFIKRTIPGRTQNKIKNKFYGNIRIFLRFVVNYFNNSKQDTMWIHKINPSILNEIYKGSQEFSQFGNQMQTAIQAMGYNVDKIRLLTRIQSEQMKYKSFYQKVIQLYKTIEENKQKSPRKNKKQSTQLSEENDIQSNFQESQYEERKNPKKENIQMQQHFNYQPLGSLYQGLRQPISLYSNYENYNNNSVYMGRQQLESSNYPLLHLQSNYPYYNYWFYHN